MAQEHCDDKQCANNFVAAKRRHALHSNGKIFRIFVDYNLEYVFRSGCCRCFVYFVWFYVFVTLTFRAWKCFNRILMATQYIYTPNGIALGTDRQTMYKYVCAHVTIKCSFVCLYLSTNKSFLILFCLLQIHFSVWMIHLSPPPPPTRNSEYARNVYQFMLIVFANRRADIPICMVAKITL